MPDNRKKFSASVESLVNEYLLSEQNVNVLLEAQESLSYLFRHGVANPDKAVDLLDLKNIDQIRAARNEASRQSPDFNPSSVKLSELEAEEFTKTFTNHKVGQRIGLFSREERQGVQTIHAAEQLAALADGSAAPHANINSLLADKKPEIGAALGVEKDPALLTEIQAFAHLSNIVMSAAKLNPQLRQVEDFKTFEASFKSAAAGYYQLASNSIKPGTQLAEDAKAASAEAATGVKPLNGEQLAALSEKLICAAEAIPAFFKDADVRRSLDTVIKMRSSNLEQAIEQRQLTELGGGLSLPDGFEQNAAPQKQTGTRIGR